jgi:hypothetical protein
MAGLTTPGGTRRPLMAEATEQRDDWPAEPTPEVETVADRLRKLEQAVSALADRTGRNGPTPDGLATSFGGLVPAALAGALVPVVPQDPPPGTEPKFWDRFAAWRELRLMVQMYFDPHYRLSRLSQFGVPALLALMVLNFFFLGAMPYIGFLLERLALVVLAVALYKLLSWEAARYAAVLRYLAQYGPVTRP